MTLSVTYSFLLAAMLTHIKQFLDRISLIPLLLLVVLAGIVLEYFFG